jgi:chromosome segregation ATPase
MTMTATPAHTDIRFECNQCGQRLVVEPAGAGMSMDCPICNTSVIVPQPSESKPSARGRRSGLNTGMTPSLSRSPYADPLPAELREELIDASLLNGKLLGDRDQARGEVARLQQQLKSVAEEHEHLNASTTLTLAEMKTFQTERQQLKGELSVLRQRLSAAEEDAANAVRRGDDWKAKAAAAEQALAGAKKTVENRAAEAAAGELALKKARNAVAELECKVAELEQRLEGEAAQRMRIAADLEDTRRDLSDAQETIALYEGELHTERTRLAQVEAALAEAQDLGLKLEAERGDLQLRLEEARPRLEGFDRLKALLTRTTADLEERTEKLRIAEESIQSLTACCAQLRHEGDSLRRDLAESHAGREILEVRDQLAATMEERNRQAARVAALEGEVRAVSTMEAATRADLERARQERDEALRKAEAFRESRTAKDNDVLRGIVERLNAEVVQRTAEVVRLKRARVGLKTAYVLFALGGLGVLAFAIKVLPHALTF